MKRERLEELVLATVVSLREQHFDGNAEIIRSALLAVERETVERCAAVCDTHEGDWQSVATQIDKGAKHYFDLASGAGACAVAIRSLLTEE